MPGTPGVLDSLVLLFNAMPDLASLLLIIVGVASLVPHISERVRPATRVRLFIAISIIGAVGVISNALQRERDKRRLYGVLTGGDSFCYVDFAGYDSTFLITNLVQVGKYDVPDVRVTITDGDAFHAALKQGGINDPSKYERGFPVIPIVSRISFWRPLATYESADYRQFTIRAYFRNGAITEFARVKRVSSGWAIAIIVAASFLDNRSGIVFKDIRPEFPTALLKDDKEWNDLSRLKRLAVDKQ
jgi:hypothetical protein